MNCRNGISFQFAHLQFLANSRSMIFQFSNAIESTSTSTSTLSLQFLLPLTIDSPMEYDFVVVVVVVVVIAADVVARP